MPFNPKEETEEELQKTTKKCDCCEAEISKEEYDANGGYCDGCILLSTVKT
jgi:hypothetical protein